MLRNSANVLHGAGRLTIKIVVVVTAAVGGGALISSSVFASLTAVATASTSVTSGTLSLTDTATAGSGGLVTAIAGMAPGDVRNRYLTLTNGGTLDADTPTVRIAGSPSTVLTSDGTKGLQITINACSVAWTQATGVCGGTTTAVLASTSALTLASDTALTLPSKLAGAITALKISIALPAGTEVTTDGVFPGGTVQGLTTTLAWTFTEAQRTAATTNG